MRFSLLLHLHSVPEDFAYRYEEVTSFCEGITLYYDRRYEDGFTGQSKADLTMSSLVCVYSPDACAVCLLLVRMSRRIMVEDLRMDLQIRAKHKRGCDRQTQKSKTKERWKG